MESKIKNNLRKTLLLFGVSIIFVSSSCKKTTCFERDYFVFGSNFNECGGNCTILFLLEDGKLHADEMESLLKMNWRGRVKKENLKFSREKLSAEKCQIAKSLLDHFPEYLKNNPGQSIGNPDGRDQGELYIELKEKNKKAIIWHLSFDVKDLPSDLQEYAVEMEKGIKILNTGN